MAATYTLELNDRQNNALSDVTSISFEKNGAYRLNRPTTWTFRVPLDQSEVNTIHSDGFPFLSVLRRQLKVYRTPSVGSPAKVFNGLVWSVERVGEADGTGSAMVTCIDPMIWWNFRPVKDAFTGSITRPLFNSPISGATIIKESLYSSILYDTTIGLNVLDGDFDESVPPAVDLAALLANWPVRIGDLAKLITDTGAVDVWIDPVDDTDGAAGPDGGGYGLEETGYGGTGMIAVMGRLNAKNLRGSEVAAHFDYATGDFSVGKIAHVQDASTITNYLHFYLGPRRGKHDWQGLINGGALLPDPPQTALNLMRDASRQAFGVWEDIQVFDAEGTESQARPMYERLWQLQFLLRAFPKEMLRITPIAEAPFLPFEDYDIGDVVTINSGGNVLGFNFTDAAQRVYGFDVSPDDNGVERIGEIVAAAGEV